ncbi:trypsin-like peptidase domain-containing protein [Spirillospora sp. NPDC046719]
MSGTLHGSVARIWSPAGTIVGAGLLVRERHVLTCAHVVAGALGIEDTGAPLPEGVVELDFPLASHGPRLTARIVHWVPVGPDGEGDIAGLLLDADPPAGTEPALLVSTAQPYGLAFRTFGFPGGRPGGDWADGVFAGVQATSWLQLEHERQTGRRVQRGYSGAPVWVDELQGVAGMVVAADRQDTDRVAYALTTETLVASWPEVLEERTIAPTPYKGLAAFRRSDAEVFFGRNEDVARLKSAVAAKPLTAVIGPSGGGKSSVVQAGLIPALEEEGSWSFAVFRPRKQPYEELARELLRLLQPDSSEFDLLLETPRMTELLERGGLGMVARRVTGDGGRLLIVGDQFEELYTHHRDPDKPRRFVTDLLGLADEPDVRLVLTMRADFLNQALGDRAFAEALTGAIEPVGPLSAAGLREAVERPAALRRAVFEPGLVHRILEDVGGRPGRLPLLEFTLSLLWERQHRLTIGHDAYEAIGGVEGALTHHAEQVLGHYPEAERLQVRQVLLQLVTPGEGTPDTRRLASRTELRPGDWPIARRLADDRLVVTGADPSGEQTVELVHEALITGWPRLREWVALDRTFRIWQERVREQIRVWRAFGEDQSVLLRGPLLAEAETWLAERDAEITVEEHEFVRLSRERQEQEDARYRRLYAEALSRQLVAHSELVRGERPNALPLSVLLAAEALRRSPSFEADLALRRGLALLPTKAVRLPHEADVQVAQFSPDGSLLVTAGDDAAARVWDVRTGEELHRLRHRSGGWLRAVAFSPDGTRLVTGSENGGARLWSLDDGSLLGELVHGGWVAALAYHPGGALLASGSDDGLVRVWDGRDTPLVSIPLDGWVRSVAFNGDGSLMVTGGADRIARIWNTADWTELARHAHGEPVRDAVFGPGGLAASASDDGTAVLWNVDGIRHVLRHDGPVTAVAFSADVRLAATACDDGHARIWDTATGAELVRLRHGGAVRAVVFDPVSPRLFTGSDDGTARVWSTGGAELLRMCHQKAVRAVAVSPGGEWGASASQDDEGALWSTTAHAEQRHQSAGGPVAALAMGGERLAASTEGAIRLWSADGRTGTAALATGTSPRVLAVSPDGLTLAGAGEGGEVRRWALPAGDPEPVLPTGAEEVRALAFAPDGRTLAAVGDIPAVLLLPSAGGAPARAELGDGAGAVAFSADGARVAALDDSGVLTLAARDGTVLEHRSFARDDWWGGGALHGFTSLAAIGRAGRTRVFDAETGEVRAEVDPESWVSRAVFSPDGRLFATVGDDAVVRVWDADTGNERCRLPHPAEVTGVVFAPDGTVVTGASDGWVRWWPLRPEDLLAQAAERVSRELTPEERSRYLGVEAT